MSSPESKSCVWIVLGALVALPILIALWPLFLIGGLLALGVWGVIAYLDLMVVQDATAWADPLLGRICRLGHHHGLIKQLQVRGEWGKRQLVLDLKLLEGDDTDARLFDRDIHLPLSQHPGSMANVGLAASLRRRMREQDFELINHLAVEAQAMQSAIGWIEELNWSRQALTTLGQMEMDVQETLDLAPGNALLEPAIPQLQEAQRRIHAERSQIEEGLDEALDRSQQLAEFLTVPASVRRMLNFDPTSFDNRTRLKDLRRTFNDLVLLNDTFRELSAQKLA